MLLPNDLNLIRQLVSAHLLRTVQVYSICHWGNVESKLAANVIYVSTIFLTSHGLVTSYCSSG